MRSVPFEFALFAALNGSCVSSVRVVKFAQVCAVRRTVRPEGHELYMMSCDCSGDEVFSATRASGLSARPARSRRFAYTELASVY